MSTSVQPTRYVILANGVPPTLPEILHWLRRDDCLICADGGARVALAHALRPDAVVGDFDSLSVNEIAALERLATPLIRFPNTKNETDLELALLLAAGAPLPHYDQSPVVLPPLPPCREMVILGALGGRTDQTLANMMLMLLPALAAIPVRMVAGHEQITCVTPTMPAEMSGCAGDTVSLLPIGGHVYGIRTDGLEYPLHDETLFFGPAQGISNVMLGSNARVWVEQGQLLCILSGVSR
ncbi:MAG: thiamine diphosphokinase [Anaerolineae bacterium]|nr:thiamine diphosphokinase [Anaerolineae bacterium]